MIRSRDSEGHLPLVLMSLSTYNLLFVISESEGGLAGIAGTGTPALLTGGARAITDVHWHNVFLLIINT